MARLANDCSYGVIALNFARAVANEDVDAAFRMLSSRVREVMSKDDLIDAYQEMISCGDGPADTVEVMIVDDDMPSFIKGDLAWVYVSILGHLSPKRSS